MLRKVQAFVKRDFLVDISYKVNFIQTSLVSIVPVVIIFFLNKLISTEGNMLLARYGGEYFSFAVIGICLNNYFGTALVSFQSSMRRAQVAGCLEAILSSQTSTNTIVLLSSIYSFLKAGLHLGIAFIAIYLFGFDFSNANFLSAFYVLLCSQLVFVGLGILSASFIIRFKQGDLVSFLLGTVSVFLCGTFFPIELFPDWLQDIAKFIPITYSLEAIRLALMQDYSPAMLLEEIKLLSIIGVILLPLGLFTFKKVIIDGRRKGSLAHY